MCKDNSSPSSHYPLFNSNSHVAPKWGQGVDNFMPLDHAMEVRFAEKLRVAVTQHFSEEIVADVVCGRFGEDYIYGRITAQMIVALQGLENRQEIVETVVVPLGWWDACKQALQAALPHFSKPFIRTIHTRTINTVVKQNAAPTTPTALT